MCGAQAVPMKNLLRTIWVIHGLMSALFACAVVVALQTAETIIKEEVICHADISTPTRVRRFPLWFFVLVIVTLAIEGLLATLKTLHEDLSQLPYAASLLASVGILLGARCIFISLNHYAEEIEPEAKREGKKFK